MTNEAKPPWVPNGYTEEQTISIIDMVVNKLKVKYQFGYHQYEDMYQEGWKFSLKLLQTGRYDSARPLEKFLYIHVRNKFLNMKRDQYHRPSSPCVRCPLRDLSFPNGCSAFEDKRDCKKFRIWEDSNIVKRNLMNLIDLDVIDDEREPNTRVNSNVIGVLSRNELEEIITECLPDDLVEPFQKVIGEEKVSRTVRARLKVEIQYILDEFEVFI
jgi:hypothetical protein